MADIKTLNKKRKITSAKFFVAKFKMNSVSLFRNNMGQKCESLWTIRKTTKTYIFNLYNLCRQISCERTQ